MFNKVIIKNKIFCHLLGKKLTIINSVRMIIGVLYLVYQYIKRIFVEIKYSSKMGNGKTDTFCKISENKKRKS